MREGQWAMASMSAATIQRRRNYYPLLQEECILPLLRIQVGIVQSSNLHFFYTSFVLLLQRQIFNPPIFSSMNCTGDCSNNSLRLKTIYSRLKGEFKHFCRIFVQHFCPFAKFLLHKRSNLTYGTIIYSASDSKKD